MSSATSTRATEHTDHADRFFEAGSEKARSKSDSTFKAVHFFVLASLMAATGAVIISRQSTAEHLLLISVTIGTAGLAAAGFYRMLSPLVSDAAPTVAEPLSERARAVLEREKALTLRALKDLEFDRSMGRMSQADFEEMSGRLRSRALSLMKQLDEDGSGYRAIIERELNTRLASRHSERAVPAPQPASLAPADKSLCRCGTRNDPDAAFCKRCGNKLGDDAVAADAGQSQSPR